MQTFTIKADAFKEIRKQNLSRTIPMMLLAMGAGFGIVAFNLKDQPGDINIWPVFIPFMLLVMAFGMYRGLKRQKLLLDSYKLTIGDSTVSREQWNTTTVTLFKTGIREITRHKNGSFIIKGNLPNELIAVPAQIDHYDELEATLHVIQPIVSEDHASPLKKYKNLLPVATVGLMICVYVATNKIVVGLSGILLVSLMIWGLVKSQASKNIDNKTKRGMWWILLVLLSVIAVVIAKLSGLATVPK